MAGDFIKEWKEGVKESWAVGLGLVPLGLAFGLLMAQLGFAWWWTPIFSILIYAGSMEFLAANFVLAGVGPVSAALAAFMVNFRHVFYGLTFPLHKVRGGFARSYSVYALTDESYAITAATRRELSGTTVLSIQVTCQLLWVVPGIVGAVAGQSVPSDLAGMEFALVALFLVLAWETFAKFRDLSLPLTAAILGVIAAVMFPGQLLMVALSAYFGVLLARFYSHRLDSALQWQLHPRSSRSLEKGK